MKKRKHEKNTVNVLNNKNANKKFTEFNDKNRRPTLTQDFVLKK